MFLGVRRDVCRFDSYWLCWRCINQMLGPVDKLIKEIKTIRGE